MAENTIKIGVDSTEVGLACARLAELGPLLDTIAARVRELQIQAAKLAAQIEQGNAELAKQARRCKDCDRIAPASPDMLAQQYWHMDSIGQVRCEDCWRRRSVTAQQKLETMQDRCAVCHQVRPIHYYDPYRGNYCEACCETNRRARAVSADIADQLRARSK